MNPTKPTLIHVIAWTTLASGVVNILFGITALGTFIGFICAPFSILPIILGAFELVYAAKLFGTQPIKPSTNIAVFELACILFGNVFSMAVGILSLVFYNDTIVKDYFARLNGFREPVTATPPAFSTANQQAASIGLLAERSSTRLPGTIPRSSTNIAAMRLARSSRSP